MNTETLTAPISWDRKASRSSGGTLRLVGHAAVFDQRSHDLGGFREEIAPGAFRRALSDPGTDVVLNADHAGLPLARQSAGTLKLSEDATGLKLTAELAPTSQARDVHALVQSGHLTDMSFAFIAGADEWTRGETPPLRRVTAVRALLDVSVVTTPAYSGTAVGARSGVRVVGERDSYGPDSEHSYFADMVRVAEAGARRQASRLDPTLRGHDPGEGSAIGNRHRGTLEEARKRLAQVEQRTLSTSEDSAIVPQNVPDGVAARFATAARAAGVMPAILPTEPIPAETGMEIKIPKLVKGASTTVDKENEAVADVDPEAGQTKVPIAYVSGEIEMSRQLLDRGRPDDAIARDLGADLGLRIDLQVLNGSGETGQTLGLLNIAGIASTAYTDATPTGSELVPKIGANFAAVATALGYAPDVLLATPARRAWIFAAEDEQKQPITPRLPASLTDAPALALGLGEGANQDAIVTLASGECTLYIDRPQIMVPVADYSGSGTLSVKVLVWTSLALLAPRPQAVGVISGTGLTTPTFA